MFKRVIGLVLLVGVVSACNSPGESVGGGSQFMGGDLKYIHDTKHGVGCWIISVNERASVTCLPDSQYTVGE